MKRYALSVISCIFLFSLVLANVSFLPVQAVESGGIGGKPANPREDNPRSHSIFVYELNPGSNINDAVEVINNTGDSKTLQVYPVDGQVASGGGFACGQKAEKPLRAGSWIKLDENEVKLGPNSSKKIGFTLSVPDNAPPGEQNGCIVIQDANGGPASQGNGIRLSFRSAIRVAVTIPGEITKALDFTGFSADRINEEKIRLSASLRNNGNVSLDSDVRTEIKTLLGNKVRSAGGEFPILAGSDAEFNFEVDTFFWGGWYKAQAIASYNSEADKSIGEGEDNTTIKSEEEIIFVAPDPLALGIEILVVLAVTSALTYFILRRRYLKDLRANAKSYKVKKGDTINSVAKSHKLNWKLLASVNNLKAPYSLEPGSTLKIPPAKKSKSR